MVDIKKILESCIELQLYETLGELYSNYYLENEILFKDSRGPIFDKSNEAYEELKELIPLWKEKYGFDENTKIAEILKTI